MSCPMCSATMHGIGSGMFHCPRCGTLKGGYVDGALTVPALVGRCREFEASLFCGGVLLIGDDFRKTWERLGIAESISPPVES